MIINEIKNIKSGREDLRKFGMTIGIFLAVIGYIILFKGKDNHLVFFLISLILLVPALFFPIILKPIQKVWMSIAILIGWVMTRVILSILFFLVVTPIGFLAKLSGKNFLDRNFNKKGESYWIVKPKKEFKKSDYEKQF